MTAHSDPGPRLWQSSRDWGDFEPNWAGADWAGDGERESLGCGGCGGCGGCLLVVVLAYVLAMAALIPLFRAVGILSLIPGPFLVDAGFVSLVCVAMGFGLGAVLERLNWKLTLKTTMLATLAIMLSLGLAVIAIHAAFGGGPLT